MLAAAWITALATLALGLFAAAAAIVAGLAFRKQSEEVRNQGTMIKIQAEEHQKSLEQFAEQRKLNEEQIKVLTLQAEEHQKSLEQLKRQEYERHRAQASRVAIDQKLNSWDKRDGDIDVKVMNTSSAPVYDAELLWPGVSLGVLLPRPNPEPLGTIIPGEVVSRGRPIEALSSSQTVLLTFRDAAGITWTLSPHGTLIEKRSDFPIS